MPHRHDESAGEEAHQRPHGDGSLLGMAVLLLNQNYVPVTVCSVRHAVVMVWLGKAEVTESTEHLLHSVSRSFVVPSIIRLLAQARIAYPEFIQLSRQNIIRRDSATCQYCGSTTGPMTVDHVIPRAAGGDDSWANLVCACSACNNRKADRTPHQAGMTLQRTPKKPNLGMFLLAHGQPASSWGPYITRQ